MRRAISFRSVAPYALLAPGLIWLGVFFVYPAIQMFLVSLWTGNLQEGFTQTWNWSIYPEALTEYWPWFQRSLIYGGLATILAFALGFPLAYAIAFRGGAYKNILLFMVIAPFFTSFLLRTISWKIILSDDGLVLGPLKAIGIIPADFQLSVALSEPMVPLESADSCSRTSARLTSAVMPLAPCTRFPSVVTEMLV